MNFWAEPTAKLAGEIGITVMKDNVDTGVTPPWITVGLVVPFRFGLSQ